MLKCLAIIFCRCCDIVISCSTIAWLFCLLTASLLRPVLGDETEDVSSLSSSSILMVWNMKGSVKLRHSLDASGLVTFTTPPMRLSINSLTLVSEPLVTMYLGLFATTTWSVGNTVLAFCGNQLICKVTAVE